MFKFLKKKELINDISIQEVYIVDCFCTNCRNDFFGLEIEKGLPVVWKTCKNCETRSLVNMINKI